MTLDYNLFKEQLYEFIEWEEQPFDVDYLIKNCNYWVDPWKIYDVLFQLEEEGRIFQLKNGKYLSLKVLLNKWIKTRFINLRLPRSLYEAMKYLIHLGYYKSMDDLIRDAIRKFEKD